MKKQTLIFALAAATITSCQQKQSLDLSPTNNNTETIVNTYRGLGLDLDITLDVDNTAADFGEVMFDIMQTAHIAVKIGGYGGGTDTAKKAVLLQDIANALGLTLEQVEDMTGLELIEALFPDISDAQYTQLSNGNYQIGMLVDEANNSFDIYIGALGQADIYTNPDFVFSFQLI